MGLGSAILWMKKVIRGFPRSHSGRGTPEQGGDPSGPPCSAGPFPPPLHWVLGYVALLLVSLEGLSQAPVKQLCTEASRPAGPAEAGLGPGAFQCLPAAGKPFLDDISAEGASWSYLPWFPSQPREDHSSPCPWKSHRQHNF